MNSPVLMPIMPNSSRLAAKPGEKIQPGLRYGPRYSSTKTMPVEANSSTMSTLSTGAAARADWAESGNAAYHQPPPSVISTAPSRAGRVDRDSISPCSFASPIVKAACR